MLSTFFVLAVFQYKFVAAIFIYTEYKYIYFDTYSKESELEIVNTATSHVANETTTHHNSQIV